MPKIDFSKVEGPSKLPKGRYHFLISDGSVKETGESSIHPGKDFWSVELTVQDGPEEGRKQYTSIMLPPYEPFTLVAILRATVGQHEWSEEDVQSGEFEVELDDLLDLEFVAKVRPQKGNDDFNDVYSYQPYDPDTWEHADLLP